MKPIFFLMSSVDSLWQSAVLPEAVSFLAVETVTDWAELTQSLRQESVAIVGLSGLHLPALSDLMALAAQGQTLLLLIVGGPPPAMEASNELLWDWIPLDNQSPAAAANGLLQQSLPRLRSYARLLESAAQVDQLLPREELTELVNRRYFMQRLADEAALSARYKTPLAIVVLAVEGFGFYLDSFGYEIIHHFVRRVVSRVGQLIRQEDSVARLGDNEVAILMPRATEAAACALLERLRADLSRLPLTAGMLEPEGEAVRLIAGLAAWPVPDDPSRLKPELLLRYSRHALHLAQHRAQEEAETGESMLSSSVNEVATRHETGEAFLVLTYCPFSAITPVMGEL